jgi:hypothetical protein
VTVIDVLIVILVIAAAIAGFRRLGGGGRAGSLLGLLVGAGLCTAVGAWLAGLGIDVTSRRVLPAIVGPGPLEPVTAVLAALGGHSAVVDAVGHAMPSSIPNP